eukprot:2829689-Rhodomonas_salina.2
MVSNDSSDHADLGRNEKSASLRKGIALFSSLRAGAEEKTTGRSFRLPREVAEHRHRTEHANKTAPGDARKVRILVVILARDSTIFSSPEN